MAENPNVYSYVSLETGHKTVYRVLRGGKSRCMLVRQTRKRPQNGIPGSRWRKIQTFPSDSKQAIKRYTGFSVAENPNVSVRLEKATGIPKLSIPDSVVT